MQRHCPDLLAFQYRTNEPCPRCSGPLRKDLTDARLCNACGYDNRLFFALQPDPAVREACAKAARDINIKNVSNGRLTQPADYHLTVLFLGDRVSTEDEAKTVRLADKLSGDPVEFTLSYASGFKESKVWWLGINDAPSTLAMLRQEVKEAVSAAGLQSDRRRFAPHVTILRGAADVLPQTRVTPIQWRSSELVLMRSRLDRSPRTYETLATIPLTGRSMAKKMEQIMLI